MPQIPPFSPQTPWLAEDKATVNYPHAQLLIALQRAAAAAPQIITGIPAHSNSPGQIGQVVYDVPNNEKYECVAANTWRRIALNNF